MSGRPEHVAPPDIFYGHDEAIKYTTNSRMIEVQSALTERAVELLNLPKDRTLFILDIGCGSGLSGETLTELGHMWVGTDISSAMLDVAKSREVEGDMLLHDMGNGLSFRPGAFDGVISISALQWLCCAYTTKQVPKKRLLRFFSTLYSCLTRGGRAVFQFYPERAQQLTLVTDCAMQCGFSGGVVIDYPNSTKAKKHFLCLFAGTYEALPTPLGVDTNVDVGDDSDQELQTSASVINRQSKKRKRETKEKFKSKNWVQNKKDRQRKQGKEVRQDSKYTARSRRKFL